MKLLEETWRWNDTMPLDVFGEEGGDLLFEGTAGRNDFSDGSERARLVACAPEMARLLLDMHNDKSIICFCCGLGTGALDFTHAHTCELDGVLRRAGILT